MNRVTLLEYISLITVWCSWLLYVINRLVVIFRKLDALKGIMLIMVADLDDVSEFLVKKHGMGDNNIKETVQSYLDQYNKTERDF